MTPTALNATLKPKTGCFSLLYSRRPAMNAAEITAVLLRGLPTPFGGSTRTDLRYSGPDPAARVCGINEQEWHFTCDIHGGKVSCTNPINGTKPGDRDDDVVFIINVRRMQEHCFMFWNEGALDTIFLTHGVEPQYIMGVTEPTKRCHDAEKYRRNYLA